MVGGDTYDSGEEGEADRNSLLVPLNASDRALRRDECGAWPITGSSARSTSGETDKRKTRRLFNAGRREGGGGGGGELRESLPELRYADVRLVEKGTAAVSEWQRLTDPQAALH